MAKSDATAIAKAFEGMAVEEDGVRKFPVPDAECMVVLVQMCGVVWERAALQAAVAALYECMKWSKSRPFPLEELEKVVGSLDEAHFSFPVVQETQVRLLSFGLSGGY